VSIKVYSYKNCSTCKKALKYLEQKKADVTVIDITETPPSKDELNAMLAIYDGNIKRLFNTSGQVYKEMGLSAKLPTLSEKQAIDLLAKNGKLVKRPFLLIGKKAGAVGFREDEWASVLKKS